MGLRRTPSAQTPLRPSESVTGAPAPSPPGSRSLVGSETPDRPAWAFSRSGLRHCTDRRGEGAKGGRKRGRQENEPAAGQRGEGGWRSRLPHLQARSAGPPARQGPRTQGPGPATPPPPHTPGTQESGFQTRAGPVGAGSGGVRRWRRKRRLLAPAGTTAATVVPGPGQLLPVLEEDFRVVHAVPVL